MRGTHSTWWEGRGGGKYPGGKYPGGKYPGGKYPRGKYPGGKYPRGKYPGGKYPGGKYPDNGGGAYLTWGGGKAAARQGRVKCSPSTTCTDAGTREDMRGACSPSMAKGKANCQWKSYKEKQTKYARNCRLKYDK